MGEKPGPKAEHLKINEDNWEKAIEKALRKKRPEGGWPNRDISKGQEDEPQPQDD